MTLFIVIFSTIAVFINVLILFVVFLIEYTIISIENSINDALEEISSLYLPSLSLLQLYLLYFVPVGLFHWMIMFLIDFAGIHQWEVRVTLYLLLCFLMIYITCNRTEALAILFVLLPATGLTILPQVLTSTGLVYLKSTMKDLVYFIYVCFGYWDSSGICRTLFQIEQKIKVFNSTASTPMASKHYIRSQSKDRASKKEVNNSVELDESFYNIISSTIGTRVLLLLLFKIFTPLALYIRFTCPFPLFVYDEKLLSRFSSIVNFIQTC